MFELGDKIRILTDDSVVKGETAVVIRTPSYAHNRSVYHVRLLTGFYKKAIYYTYEGDMEYIDEGNDQLFNIINT